MALPSYHDIRTTIVMNIEGERTFIFDCVHDCLARSWFMKNVLILNGSS